MKGQVACTDDVRVRRSFQDNVQQLRAAALRVAWLDVARSSQSWSWKHLGCRAAAVVSVGPALGRDDAGR